MRINPSPDLGVKFLIGLSIFIFVVFWARLFYVQVYSYDFFKKRADNQQITRKIIEPERGQIFSNDGFVLATNNTSYNLIIDPSLQKDIKSTLQKISERIEFESEDEKKIFLDKVSVIKPDLKYFILKQNFTKDQKDKLEPINIPGVYFEKRTKRFYPENGLASSVLGYVGESKAEVVEGYYGIEGRNDQLLRGRSGRLIYEKGGSGQVIPFGNYDMHESIDGDSIVLTIDRSVQYIIEKKLKDGVEKYGAKSGQIIVMNPITGDIIGMANYPSFDPSNPGKEYLDVEKKFKSELKNKAISDNIEPGSVIKPITIAIAIDLGLISPDFSFDDNGPLQFDKDIVDNWDKKHIGRADLTTLLQKSNNIGAAIIGLKIGSNNFKKYLDKFGFGRSTEIELQGEERGDIRQKDFWSPLDIASTSFGQSINATLLQVLVSYTVFLNDGNLIRPKIIKEIIKSDGERVPYPNMIEKEVIKKDTASFMNKILTTSFANNESKYFNLKKYSIGGKTGTAQIANKGQGYLLDKTNALFVGYLANSKKFSMIVRLEEPSSSTFAAETAVPLWMNTANELINYYNIPTDFAN